jgi:hypothetical protein
MLPQLNLPSFSGKIREADGKLYILDLIRKKYVQLTPEEWVRQHFIHLLVNHYQYPKSLFAIETGMYYNRLKKRSDILVLKNDGTPFMLVECKAPSIPLKRGVFDQISRYNFTLKPDYLVVTNGMEHFCFRVSAEGQTEFLTDLPQYVQGPDR